MSKIKWTNVTWNPVTGCTKTSPGCLNCYAERMAKRLAGRFGYPENDPFKPSTIHYDKMNAPFSWNKPLRIFVCSMGDLFHPAVPDDIIRGVLDVCHIARHHTFQILTKRPDLRTPYLRQVQAKVRFVSLEPLLSDINMGDISWLQWAIVGSESGQKARPMDENWVRNIRDQCQSARVAFFYKQKIVDGKKILMPPLDGKVWEEYPII
jgi:protein gp37